MIGLIDAIRPLKRNLPIIPVDEYMRLTLRRALERPSVLEEGENPDLDDPDFDPDGIDLEPDCQLVDADGGLRKIPVRYDEANEDDF